MTRYLQVAFFSVIFFCCPLAKAAEDAVVILLSNDLPVYQIPVRAIEQKYVGNAYRYSLQGDVKTAPKVMQAVMSHKPRLIFALGAKAAWFAKLATEGRPETAVVFAMVLDYQRYNLLDGRTNIAGIANEVTSGTQLINMSLFSPGVKKVGVIYSPTHSAQSLREAQRAAELIGLQLILKPIERAKEFRRAWLQISDKIDAFWVFNDPELYTLKNIYWLKDRCIKEQRICMGQTNNITRFGMLFSVNADLYALGNQAVSMAEDILVGGVTPSQLGVQAPIGTHLTMNPATAKKIGIQISTQALNLVDEILSE